MDRHDSLTPLGKKISLISTLAFPAALVAYVAGNSDLAAVLLGIGIVGTIFIVLIKSA